jgi:transcriptional regulator with XRE-family HTH domain
MPGRLREIREAKGLTMRELGRLSGVTRPTLYMAEADIDRVRVESLIKIAKALGVTLAEIAPDRASEYTAALAEVS